MAKKKKGVMIGRIKQGNEKWRIMGVYVGENREEVLKKLEEWGENREKKVYTLIRGDFNARTGREGGVTKIG